MRITRLVFPVFALLLVAAVVPTILVRAQSVQLLINKAVYGKSGAGRDVTMRLKRMVSNGTLDVKITNDNMGGDPNKGADKSLKVDYTFRGQRKRVVVKEGDQLKLP
jgi:DnaJ-like protein C11, C-terminal